MTRVSCGASRRRYHCSLLAEPAIRGLGSGEGDRAAGLFKRLGQAETSSVPWKPTPAELHRATTLAQNGFSRDRMSRRQAADFDAAMRARIAEQVRAGSVRMENGRLQGEVVGSVVWGKPMAALVSDTSPAAR